MRGPPPCYRSVKEVDMADLLANVDDLVARLDWELSPDERRIAEHAIEDLSDEARFLGSSAWTATSAPRIVRTTILKAAQRFMRNPDGYVQSRAGDEVVGWAALKREVGAPEFSPEEKDRLKDAAKRSATINYVQSYVYNNSEISPPRDIHVPVNYGGRDFPFLSPPK